jgi:hypothetical protein
MPYYKLKIKSFDNGGEQWIALRAEGVHDAIEKITEYCTHSRTIYYPLEQSLQEITPAEYARDMHKIQPN